MGQALPILSLIGKGIGTVAGVVGALQTSRAAREQANYQAEIARNNQILANRAAKETEQRGEREEYIQRLRTRQAIGKQKVAFASNGVLVDAGSAATAVADTAQFGELDALTIRDNAAREAARWRAQGMNFASEAELAKMRAKAAKSEGFGQAFSTALTGAASVADKWYQYKSEGVQIWPWGSSSTVLYPSGDE